MTATATMSSIIEILVGAISGVASGIGSGLSTLVQSIVYTTSGDQTTLSAFFIMVVIFAGISLATGLCRWVVNFATSLGQRNK